nr:uncharacterized protein CTRU02_14940 [Colletotrichum truncatum]KAF6781642.1 hypothetical protein CTRU02_14940 [Colletotrichum truncatum]
MKFITLTLFSISALTAAVLLEPTKVIQDTPHPVLAAREVCCSETYPQKKCVCFSSSQAVSPGFGGKRLTRNCTDLQRNVLRETVSGGRRLRNLMLDLLSSTFE